MKFSSVKFHENPRTESRADKCGQTDGQIRRNMRFFFEYANASNSPYFHPMVYHVVLMVLGTTSNYFLK